MSSFDKVIDYCRAKQGYDATESFRILYLNTQNALIADESDGAGTIDHCPAYPREIVKRAVLLDAAAIILIHNHPSGTLQPSKGDISVTQDIVAALKTISVTVHDHLIVASTGHYSFRSAGLI